MDESTQAGLLGAEIDRVIERFRSEFDMTYMSVIGVLETKKHLLIREAIEIAEEQAEEQDEGESTD
jgi:hypothetical protein